ncbi:hypothetical protein EES44_06520 [Streptomyces sp. ADI96-15]|nr:hypothetical protein EES44_06520 [Streptomyces sp. ADI96-15]
MRLGDAGRAELGTRLVVVRRVRGEPLVGVEGPAGDLVDVGEELGVARGAGLGHVSAVGLVGVLPEAPGQVHDDGLEGLVEAADGGEGGPGLLGQLPVLLAEGLAAQQGLALDGVQGLAALGGADLLQEAVVGGVLAVDHVVGSDVGDDGVHVTRVEPLVVGGGHAALGAAGGQPLLAVDGLEGLEEAVLVAGGLPDRQLRPVGGFGARRGEVTVLQRDLVAVDDPGGLAAAGGGGDAVAGGVEDGRAGGVLVQHGEPLPEGAPLGVPVVDRLGVGEDEVPVPLVRLLLDQLDALDGEQPLKDVPAVACRVLAGHRGTGLGRDGPRQDHERQQPAQHRAHEPSPVPIVTPGASRPAGT